jgi:DNA-binding NarL/FixJ family response regulator
VIADDHAVLRGGVRAILERASEPTFDVVGEAGDVAETLELVRELMPDLLVLDIRMPSGSGLSIVPECRKVCPEMVIVVLSMHTDEAFVREAVAAGVQGYLLKDSDPRELIEALRSALRGRGLTLSPGIAARLASTRSSATEPLSARERETIAMIACGYTYQEIGERLFCSERTVKTYRARAAVKLGISTRAELTAFAHREGLVTSEQIAGLS